MSLAARKRRMKMMDSLTNVTIVTLGTLSSYDLCSWKIKHKWKQ